MELKKQFDWPQSKQRLKDKYPQLTEEDLVYETGKEEELLDRLQKKLDRNREEIRSWLSLMG